MYFTASSTYAITKYALANSYYYVGFLLRESHFALVGHNVLCYDVDGGRGGASESHCPRTARVIGGLDGSVTFLQLQLWAFFGIIYFHNSGGLPYNGQIKRV
jgi:hypothetical protein